MNSEWKFTLAANSATGDHRLSFDSIDLQDPQMGRHMGVALPWVFSEEAAKAVGEILQADLRKKIPANGPRRS